MNTPITAQTIRNGQQVLLYGVIPAVVVANHRGDIHGIYQGESVNPMDTGVFCTLKMTASLIAQRFAASPSTKDLAIAEEIRALHAEYTALMTEQRRLGSELATSSTALNKMRNNADRIGNLETAIKNIIETRMKTAWITPNTNPATFIKNDYLEKLDRLSDMYGRS